MNKEKLLNYFKKNKIAFIIGSIMIICYYLTHTNFSYHLEDRTGKYILNPEYKEFHKYEWTDLKSVYPTKLAYDPEWFKLPPEKYIPKEQPIPREISNISDPIIRRQAYFNFLCKTEYAAYMTNDIKTKKLESMETVPEGVLDLTIYKFFTKTKTSTENFQTSSFANSNPFIFPIYSQGFQEIDTNKFYNFLFIELEPIKNINIKYNENKFKEFISSDGNLYSIKFDNKSSQFLPLQKIKNSEARYYIIQKYIEKESFKNLGIAGYEEIIYDRKEKKLVFYIKQFNMGAFLPWKDENAISNFSWAKQSGCVFNPQYIDNF